MSERDAGAKEMIVVTDHHLFGIGENAPKDISTCRILASTEPHQVVGNPVFIYVNL